MVEAAVAVDHTWAEVVEAADHELVAAAAGVVDSEAVPPQCRLRDLLRRSACLVLHLPSVPHE